MDEKIAQDSLDHLASPTLREQHYRSGRSRGQVGAADAASKEFAFVLWTDGSSQACDIGWGALLWAHATQDVKTLAGGERFPVAPGHGSEVAEWYAAAEGLKLVRIKKQSIWLLSDCQSVVTFINDVVQGGAIDADAVLARVGPHAFFEVGHAVTA